MEATSLNWIIAFMFYRSEVAHICSIIHVIVSLLFCTSAVPLIDTSLNWFGMGRGRVFPFGG